jgi:predicted transcriptional regulator
LPAAKASTTRPEIAPQLDVLAAATGRTKSFLAGQTIRDFIERESWQIAEITQAITDSISILKVKY